MNKILLVFTGIFLVAGQVYADNYSCLVYGPGFSHTYELEATGGPGSYFESKFLVEYEGVSKHFDIWCLASSPERVECVIGKNDNQMKNQLAFAVAQFPEVINTGVFVVMANVRNQIGVNCVPKEN